MTRKKSGERVLTRVPVGLDAEEHAKISVAAQEAGVSIARFLALAAMQAIERGGLAAPAPEATLARPVVVLRRGTTDVPESALSELLPMMLDGRVGAYPSHRRAAFRVNSYGDVRLRVAEDESLVEVRVAASRYRTPVVEEVPPQDAARVALRLLDGGTRGDR